MPHSPSKLAIFVTLKRCIPHFLQNYLTSNLKVFAFYVQSSKTFKIKFDNQDASCTKNSFVVPSVKSRNSCTSFINAKIATLIFIGVLRSAVTTSVANYDFIMTIAFMQRDEGHYKITCLVLNCIATNHAAILQYILV